MTSKVKSARQRLEDLYRRAGIFPGQKQLLEEALTELSIALQELQVSAEEMRQYNDELAAAQQRVEAERQRYRELFEFVPAGYLVTDRSGIIQEANLMAAYLFGRPQEYLVGKPLPSFIRQADHASFEELINSVLTQDFTGEWRTECVLASGISFSAALHVSKLRDPVRGAVGLRWLLQDIATRKEAEAALHASRDQLEKKVRERTSELVSLNEALSDEIARRNLVEGKLRESEDQLRRFAQDLEQQLISSNRLVSSGEIAASIAHELSNSLQVILGFTEDLRTTAKVSQADPEALKIIETEALRCKDLVKDLMGFARPTHTDLAMAPVEAIIEKSLRLARGYLQKSSVKVKVELQPDLPQIRADANQLEQVLVNLFYNAADAMSDGGTVTVRAETSPVDPACGPGNGPSELRIAVSDTGVGMDFETLSKIFLPFFSTKSSKGMGLGLSICNRIVKAHGGQITVESKLGAGTTFFLHFPVASKKHSRG